MDRATLYGAIPRRPADSKTSFLVVEPSAGFSLSRPATDLRPGQTPFSENFLMREGGLELRPSLSSFSENAKPLDYVTGVTTIVSSTDSHYPLASGTSQFAFYVGGAWSLLSYVTSGASDPSAPPSGTTIDYYDIVQSYEPTVDDNLAILGCQSYQTLFCWQPGQPTFSSITSAPRARFLATFNNYVLAGNIRDVGSAESKYVQRVQWSDRGSPLTWSFGGSSLAGFEDLLDANGQITRLMALDDRVIIFFEDEIWQGIPAVGLASFTFSPLDRSIGTPYSWSVARTTAGIMFLGRDLVVYLLPKSGGVVVPAGASSSYSQGDLTVKTVSAVRRWLAGRLNNPAQSWALYDPETRQYRLYYAVLGGPGVPTESVWLNIDEDTWAPQVYTHGLTRGFVSFNDSIVGGITWDQLTQPWSSIGSTWAQMGALVGFAGRAIGVGTSSGSLYYESNGTLDDTTPISATWRSAALGGDAPRNMKALQEVRLDYQSAIPSAITLRASRDVGATFDPAVTVTLPAAAYERNAVGHVYAVGQYPVFQVEHSDNELRIVRFHVQYTVGGSSA